MKINKMGWVAMIILVIVLVGTAIYFDIFEEPTITRPDVGILDFRIESQDLPNVVTITNNHSLIIMNGDFYEEVNCPQPYDTFTLQICYQLKENVTLGDLPLLK